MTEDAKSYYIPLMVDLREHPALVIGGGPVAARKIRNLLAFNGEVTVISPEFIPEIQEKINDGIIKGVQKKYESGDADNFKIVFCATDDPEVDRQVHKDCAEKGILLNVADVPELCAFIMPATIKRGTFTASFSSQGNAPFYSKEMRDQFDKILSPMVADSAELAYKFRKKLMADERFENPEKRYGLFKKFLQYNWDIILYECGKKEAYKKMEALFEV